ncbi:MAG TPA: LuxR C-terminal-related transcriptional regulator [Flavisolibacter sp.]|nr:LuxR C-terminal-related transcriptional regulator [Flavisolibacter sp.]
MKQIELTAPELKLLKLICKQLTSKEIAAQLGLSHRTIEERRLKLQKKLKVKNAVGIALYAVRNGIIKLTP